MSSKRITSASLGAILAFIAGHAVADDYAAWAKKNSDGSWTASAESAVASSGLTSAIPSDIDKFCPAYRGSDSSDRKIFWVGLISIVAKPESNFKPEERFTEKFIDAKGNKVISRGLLQISIESANQVKYSCNVQKANDLHNPATNLACGVKILDAWVETDGVIATYGDSPKGGGRYWSTFRQKHNHLPELMSFTRGMKVCRAP